MPSKGTKTYAVRLSPDLVQRVQAQIDSRNTWSPEEPWDLSAFIRVCLERELRKMARSRRRRPRCSSLATSSVQLAGDVHQLGEG
jgi:hypothetical protein